MKVSKQDVAIRQLNFAIDLFLSNKEPLAVITLAGAAEEILGRLVSRDGKVNMKDELVRLDKELTGGREFVVVSNEINGLRNSLKHANDLSENFIEYDEAAPLAYLMRAIVNYQRLGLVPTQDMQVIFEEAKKLEF